MAIVVQPGQCLMDIAIQYGGDATAIVDIALQNGLAITDDVLAGQVLLNFAVADTEMAAYILAKGYVPATDGLEGVTTVNNGNPVKLPFNVVVLNPAECIVDVNQCLFDIAIQYQGDFTAIVDLALLNGLAITDDIAPGLVLAKQAIPANTNVADYFRSKSLVPATAFTDANQAETNPGGIGYWYIQQDFIIS